LVAHSRASPVTGSRCERSRKRLMRPKIPSEEKNTYAVVLTFLIMVLVLAFRPQGLVAMRR
jgi:ABC-type branched-subunit amino acid transport system permease subunit